MTKSKYYAGVDYFRLVAALLIVAIHTSPLATYNETGDFILTRIVARVAVPFFFMASGFFVISRYSYNTEKLMRFVKRTASIYGAAILLYIPINIYNGYFRMENLLPNVIKDIVFDGTLYHLWYLPASILGALIAWYLVKRFDYKRAFIITAMLYVIGLLGDSYYGITEQSVLLKNIYDMLFQISDYTRNGIFFAPVFLVMGGFFADTKKEITLAKSISGFGISFVLLFMEAMILRSFELQRHDSIYVFLLPCMFFLFCGILRLKGKHNKNLKTISLLIYIIHPMMIVVVRLIAKLVHLENLLIDNSLIHYIVVCFASVVFSFVLTVLLDKFHSKNSKSRTDIERACADVDLNNLEHNVKVLKNAMPPKCELMAVVKAEAYGHGAFEISTHLNKIGINTFAVATIDEGIKLRKYGVRGEILILGYTDISRASELKKYDLSQTLIDYEYANALNQSGVTIKAHIKVNTGMNRLGISSEDSSKVGAIFKMKYIKVSGIFTHLCCSDSLSNDDVAFTNQQINNFYKLIDVLKDSGIRIPKLHIQSSYGLLNYPNLECDYVRVGIALYGVLSSPNDDTKLKLDLRPVLSLKSKVVLIRQVSKGESVGYSRNFTAERDSKIAILPIGYADGLPRNLSCEKGGVLINHCYAPIIGNICMDQLAVDITDIDDVTVGAIATLISTDEYALSAASVADKSDSISNELLSRIGKRVPIRIKNS